MRERNEEVVYIYKKELKYLIHNNASIVFFGGAGVSTESGIPDFRSESGLYNQQYQYPPETMLSHSFFISHTEEFFDFYRSKMLYLDAIPNAAHIALAELEKNSKLKAIITQNIDGLHQKAGSKNVLELHGSVHRNFCTACGHLYGVEIIKESEGIPRCECGGVIKPDVVLYEEALNEEIMYKSVKAITKADLLIVGGTSLNVYPAAGLIRYYQGAKLVLINKSATPLDSQADLVIHDSIGKTLSEAITS